MMDAPHRAEGDKPSPNRPRPSQGPNEWRAWQIFGCCLGLLIFALVVISVSL